MVLARATSPAILGSAFQGAGTSQAYTSNTFSPPAGSTIVVVGFATESFNATFNTPTITDSLATHLVWNLVTFQADLSVAAATSLVALWWANCPNAQTNMTVTQTMSCASGQTITYSGIAPAVWTGADQVNPIPTFSKGFATVSPASATVTPVGSGSALLMASAQQAAASTASTAGTGCFLVNETHTATSNAQIWYGSSGAPTIGPGAQTLSIANAKASPKFQWIAYEIQAAAGAAVSPSPKLVRTLQAINRSNVF